MTTPRKRLKQADLAPADQDGRQELIIPEPERERSMLFVRPDACPADYPTNLPDSPWGRALRVNAENASEYEADRSGVVEMDVAYFLVHPSERVNEETGEVADVLRTVLIDPSGKHIATTSEVVRRRMLSLIGHFGFGPWLPPVRVQIRSRRNRGNTRTYHEMVIVLPPGDG